MPNKFVIFPAEKLAAAQAYKAWADAWVADFQSEPGLQLGLLNTDAFGQHVCVYLGPPYVWETEVPEPLPDGPVMRADGVLHDNWVRPDVEE